MHVSASQFETLGNTVLEAFASNIPVVVPYTQGFRDTVTTQDTVIPRSAFTSSRSVDADGNSVKRHDGYLFTAGDAQSARKYVLVVIQ